MSAFRGAGRGPLLLAATLLLPACGRVAAEPVRELRVCADPNNLPFSNQRGEWFENRLAERFAGELNARLTYTSHAQRRGFCRETLREFEEVLDRRHADVQANLDDSGVPQVRRAWRARS